MTRRTSVTVDARNHGESPHSPEMSYGLMAKDLRHLLKHIQMDKISVLGKSVDNLK